MPLRLLVLSLLFAIPLAAQDAPPAPEVDAAAALITADSLKAHLAVLASNEYGGRNSGEAGNVKASEYVAAHFKKIGLKPAGVPDDAGQATWYQPFTFKAGKAEVSTRNVLGLLEGSDPALKSEIVVIGAHFDHVGQAGERNAGRMKSKSADPEDKIWNGADDNGSGTVTVLEIARGFAEGKLRPKRSILFMTFSAEEYGLYGSKHYAANPTMPLAKTVAMINLDMVGRNGTKPMDVGGVSTAAEWTARCEAAAKGTGLEITMSQPVLPYSDHFPFAAKRVPAIHFFTGFHDDYHTQADHVERIEFDHMTKISRFGLRLASIVADGPRMSYTGSGSRTLGVDAEEVNDEGAKTLELGEGEGGIRIRGVNEDSVASIAGIKKGDVIVSIKGKKLPRIDPLAMLRSELKTVKDGVDVPIVVLRDGKPVELKAVWGKVTY